MPVEAEELVLAIDENDLLNEWKSQAAMMLEYGIQFADATQEEDEARARLTIVTAETERDIRARPDVYDINKITEAAVQAAIPIQPEHKNAIEAYNDAKHKVRVLRAAVDAISHRKSTLQGMTDLFLRQWYADPKSSEQPEKLREAAKTVITRRRKRRRVED